MKSFLVILVTLCILFTCSQCEDRTGRFVAYYWLYRNQLNQPERVTGFTPGAAYGLPGFRFQLHHGYTSDDTKQFHVALELDSYEEMPLVHLNGSATLRNVKNRANNKIVHFVQSLNETHKTMDKVTIMPLNDILDAKNGFVNTKYDMVTLGIEIYYKVHES